MRVSLEFVDASGAMVFRDCTTEPAFTKLLTTPSPADTRYWISGDSHPYYLVLAEPFDPEECVVGGLIRLQRSAGLN